MHNAEISGTITMYNKIIFTFQLTKINTKFNVLVGDELTGFHFRNGCPFGPFGPFLNLRLLLPVPVS